MAIPPILWQPSERAIEEAQITQFARQIVRKRRLELNSYPEFYRWTVDNPEEFWSDVWDFCGVIASRRGSSVLVDGDKMPGAHWFPEARLNFAENLMRRGNRGDAFVLWDERGFRRRVSFADRYSDVSRAVQALQVLGLRDGDRAAAFIPNIPEAGMLALAALSQGIVWSSCSPDFGVDGVVERFGQIEPKVLFCADGYRYNGQEHDTLERAREIVERLPTLRKAVVVPSLDEHVDVSDVPKAVRLDEWLRRYTAGDIAFAQLPFDHPVYILFTSGTTGKPLAPESFDYVYDAVKSDVCLSSISGGTDIMAAFADANPILPVYRGELQCRSLGIAVEVFNDNGESIINEKGELVCTKPFPSMPLGFWNDRGDERYHAAYFAKYPNVWCHGDWSELTERGTMIIYGRSDATLNPGGVRIGTAEIYRVVERNAEVEEAVAIGQIWQSDTRVVLFVKLRDGQALDARLEERIRSEIRRHASPRHVPAKIVQVDDIPRTKNGKVVELAVKAVVHGMPVPNTDALANPDALEHFRDLPQLAE